MLEDRDYMSPDEGGSWSRRLTVSLWLVIINVAVYAALLIVPLLVGASSRLPLILEEQLALWPSGILHGRVWQLLTFQFLHAGPLHLLLNCAMLYIFGRAVEATLGRISFLKLYFLSGAFGGLFQVGLTYVFPQRFGMGPVVGASAGIFGLIAAFATLNANQPITMLLAFILPVTMRAKYLLLVEAIMAVLGLLSVKSGIAHGAHLGGMIMGVLYVRMFTHWSWPGFGGSRRTPPRELVSAGSAKPRSWRRNPSEQPEGLSNTEFFSKEVDPILEKISAHGIHSLTEKERKTLEAARKKMSGR
jgi:membrane associated rhomboid family serine protease